MKRYDSYQNEDPEGNWVHYEDVKQLELNLVVVVEQHAQVLDLVKRALQAGENLAKEMNMPFWHIEQKSPDPKKMEAALQEILRVLAESDDNLSRYIRKVAEEGLK